MSKAVAWQLRRIEGGKPGPWGPPTKSKGVADALVAEGMECRGLAPVEEVFGLSREERLERVALRYLSWIDAGLNKTSSLEDDLNDEYMVQ